MPARRAFVSHATADDSYVAELESFLRATGYDEVFNDVSAIRPDERFWAGIEKGISGCDSFVVVITHESNASAWVAREVEFARRLSKKVIPIWIEDCDIPSVFADRDVIDFRPRARRERRFDISRIVKYAPAELIGREKETALLNETWAKVQCHEAGRPRVLTFVALGGEGKTSLVTKWAAELAAQDWPGCDAAFAWSFYSQGAKEQVAASSDLFLKEALVFFGDDADKTFAASNAGAYEKGQQLARLVGRRRGLLILDGLEPLQYSPTSPTPGQLKDQGIAALLRGVATSSNGLCIVTTRYSVPDLRAFWQSTAQEAKLLRLSRGAGVHLLKTLGVNGSERRNLDYGSAQEKLNEYETLVEDVKGHALTLQIMGSFLKRAFGGDIRQRDRVKFGKADEKIDGGHAFRAMAAYATWMEDGGAEARRELAILRCLGLFDRPATYDCVEALLQPPAIAGLTEPLVGMAEDDWRFSFDALDRANLLAVNSNSSSSVVSLDTHPHIREYFAKQLREKNPDAWRAAHRRIYEHLSRHSREGQEPTLEELQPLYQAVAHGCRAGLVQEASDVYSDRILRGNSHYSWKVLGLFGSDLATIACFFEQPWSRASPALSWADQAWVTGQSALYLRALGRLEEALQPMATSFAIATELEDWANMAVSSANMGELKLTLGEIGAAIEHAEQAVTHAARGDSQFFLVRARAIHAEALHQAGHRAEAEKRLVDTEKMQADREPADSILFSLSGFAYCDVLLASAERAAWLVIITLGKPRAVRGLRATCRALAARAVHMRKLSAALPQNILSIGLDHLTLGRAAIYEVILAPPNYRSAVADIPHFDIALDFLRRAGTQEFIVPGLLTRSWLRFLADAHTGPKGAQEDLDEAWEIAERGPMKLHMADIHLYRARLFFRETAYPWISPQADLAAAEKLINECGYHRRDEELADAKAAIAKHFGDPV